MAKGASSTTALLVDDEPEHLEFLVDYLESRGLTCRVALTLREALTALGEHDFRVLVIDMNIPPAGALTPEVLGKAPLASKYPGIALAREARNRGYGAHSVIAYTVHDDDAADAELGKLHCRYVLKGRPGALKSVIEKSLEPSRK